MSSITDPEVRAFLTEGTRTGKLSFLSPSGHPLVTPVWFVLEGDTVVFNTGSDTAKGRYLARDPRVSLCVDLEAPPYAFVQVQGNASLSEQPDELVRTATLIGARYMGPEREGVRQAQRRAGRVGGANPADQGAGDLRHDRLTGVSCGSGGVRRCAVIGALPVAAASAAVLSADGSSSSSSSASSRALSFFTSHQAAVVERPSR